MWEKFGDLLHVGCLYMGFYNHNHRLSICDCMNNLDLKNIYYCVSLTNGGRQRGETNYKKAVIPPFLAILMGKRVQLCRYWVPKNLFL